MNNPYYSDESVTIYHGDCREILPALPKVDVVLTDPPWLASKASLERVNCGGVAPALNKSLSLSYGTIGEFDVDVIRQCVAWANEDVFVICGYKELGYVINALEPHRGVFVWHKPNGGRTVAYPAALDTAFIVWGGQKSQLYGFQHWESSVFSIHVPAAGCMKTERYLQHHNGPASHPAQGPLRLYAQLLRPFATRNLCVLDPYMGTGTTLRAAKDLDLRAIGIEIEEKYCEIAAERMRQQVLTFDDVVTQPQQVSMLQ